jgi:hypothetical protein
LPIEKPSNGPPLIAAEIILPKASITKTNNKGDKESPYLKPW